MSWQNDDNSGDLWGNEEKKVSWDDNSGDPFNAPKRDLHLNFKFNPKVVGIVAASLVVLLIGGTVVKNLGGSNSNNGPTPSLSTTKTAQASPVDLYTQPKMLQSFIDNALASAVTIYCGNYTGSGWAIDLSDDPSTTKDDRYPTEIITNNHVVEGCNYSDITIVPMGTKDSYDAYVYTYESQNDDFAILMTEKYIVPFATVQPGNEAKVGQWVMAVGSPAPGGESLDGSITTGTITNLKEGVVITDTTINPGNSGGPLLNAAGQVIAVVTWKVNQDGFDRIGVAQNVNLICDLLASCTTKTLLK